MDYREYEVEDFLLDPSFCNYCLGKDEQSVIFWEEWISDHPERYEIFLHAKELYSLLNGNHTPSQYFRDEKAFLAKMGEHLDREQGAFLHGEILEEILSSGTQPAKPEPALTIAYSFKKIIAYAGTIAAMILLAICIPMFVNRTVSKPAAKQGGFAKTSKTGERKSFQLADGTTIMLNAGSTLKIAKEFNVSMREVWLEGEAFFDVTHNAAKPFVIHTASMDVKVLGTVFNIRDYPSDKVMEASLLKGSVAVFVKGSQNKEIILHPNEKIVLLNEKAVVSLLHPLKAAITNTGEKKYRIASLTYNRTDSSLVEFSWTENRLAFNETNFEDIAGQLERWYNVSIRFDNETVKQYRFTATFDKSTLSQILSALQLSRHFEYEIKDGNQVIIK